MVWEWNNNRDPLNLTGACRRELFEWNAMYKTTQAKIYIFDTYIKVIFCYIVDVHDLVGT